MVLTSLIVITAHMHGNSLRVFNEGHVAAAKGLGMRPHRGAEMSSYVLSTAITRQYRFGSGL